MKQNHKMGTKWAQTNLCLSVLWHETARDFRSLIHYGPNGGIYIDFDLTNYKWRLGLQWI